MEIYVIRHGQTDWNIERRLQGKRDIPLNKTGREQALQTKKMTEKIDYDLILYSPLSRAKETAEIINSNKNQRMEVENFLVERDFGEFEGVLKTDFDYSEFWNYYSNLQYNSAENIKDFFNRIYKGLDTLESKYKANKILIVCHGGVGLAIECYFNGVQENLLDLIIKNAEVKKYDTKNKK